jgi:hypothetical protein
LTLLLRVTGILVKIFSFSFESLGNGNAAPNINEVSGNVFVYETSLLPASVEIEGLFEVREGCTSSPSLILLKPIQKALT